MSDTFDHFGDAFYSQLEQDLDDSGFPEVPGLPSVFCHETIRGKIGKPPESRANMKCKYLAPEGDCKMKVCKAWIEWCEGLNEYNRNEAMPSDFCKNPERGEGYQEAVI